MLSLQSFPILSACSFRQVSFKVKGLTLLNTPKRGFSMNSTISEFNYNKKYIYYGKIKRQISYVQ